MEWSEVHDPTGNFDLYLENASVTGSYSPEEVRDLINTKGIAGMVTTVNEHFRSTSNQTPALKITHRENRQAVARF